MFLIRTAFWLSIVILFLPTGGSGAEQEIEQVQATSSLGPVQAFGAARQTIADLGGFCSRNPATCETGAAALQIFGQKAQYGAQLVYGYLAEMNYSALDFRDSAHARQAGDTLRPGDLAEPWRGPDLRS